MLLTVTVEPVSPNQYEATADLLEQVYVGEEWSPETSRAALRDVASRTRAATTYVARDETGAIVGTVALLRPGTQFAQISSGCEMEARLLAVSPTARHGGIGEALMRACIEAATAEGAASLVLSTQSGMEAAQRLYERMGFLRQSHRDWQREGGPQMLAYLFPIGLEPTCDRSGCS